jgi:hypothetical protein
MLTLILILNYDRFGSDEPTARLVVPEGEYIISMQINNVEIEKAGQLWRIDPNGIQPSVLPDAQQLQDIVSAWQRAYITPAGIEFDAALFGVPSSLVVISLAGVSTPTVVALNIVEEQLFIVIKKEVFILNSPTISALLEPIIQVRQ